MQRPVMVMINKPHENICFWTHTHLYGYERHASDGADVAFLKVHEADGKLRVHDCLSQHSLLQSAVVDLRTGAEGYELRVRRDVGYDGI